MGLSAKGPQATLQIAAPTHVLHMMGHACGRLVVNTQCVVLCATMMPGPEHQLQNPNIHSPGDREWGIRVIRKQAATEPNLLD